MNRTNLYKLLENKFEFLQFCFDNGLLKKICFCQICFLKKKLIYNEKVTDGFEWKCSSKKCSKSTTSIRIDSVFSGFKLSLIDILKIIYEFSVKTPALNIHNELSISKTTITKYLRFCRLLIENYYFQFNYERKIGGQGKVVEIDECCLYRRKYNVGRMLNQIWIFGGIERGAHGKCFFEKVNSRNSSTLKEVLARRVNSGTLIISDGWKAYKELNELGFLNEKVNHSINFINPINNLIHTQTIEST